MREIKFRGYDKNYKKWCYGSLMAGWDGQWYIEFYINRSLQKYRVDVNSIGQYTGFKDKNGKEIYEGDIINNENTDYTIKFKKGCWIAEDRKCLNEWFLFGMCNVEVIGNVFEEQLKRGNK